MTPVRFVPYNAQTGQSQNQEQIPAAFVSQAQRQAAIDQVRAAFQEVTLPLVIGAIGLGIATGFGSTIGTFIGSLVADRWLRPRPPLERRRR